MTILKSARPLDGTVSCRFAIKNAPIEFDRIVVHYGNGAPEVLQVRDVIRRGGKSRAIALQGDRFVQSFELWYGKARPNSGKPELTLWGQH